MDDIWPLSSEEPEMGKFVKCFSEKFEVRERVGRVSMNVECFLA